MICCLAEAAYGLFAARSGMGDVNFGTVYLTEKLPRTLQFDVKMIVSEQRKELRYQQ